MYCKECGKDSKNRDLCDKCRKAAYRAKKRELSPNVPKKLPPECPQLNELSPKGNNVPSEIVPKETSDNTEQTDIERGMPNPSVVICDEFSGLPDNFGQPDCQCRHCLNIHKTRPDVKLNHGSYMTAAELVLNGYKYNRVSLC
jgi:hypothetical protein